MHLLYDSSLVTWMYVHAIVLSHLNDFNKASNCFHTCYFHSQLTTAQLVAAT